MLLVCIDLGVRSWALLDPGLASLKPLRLVSLFPFLHGSLFYLYVRSLIDGEALRLRDLRHALGFALALIATLDLFLLPQDRLAQTLQDAYRQGVPLRAELINIGLFGYALAYVAAALLALRRHRLELLAERSDSHPDALRWLAAMAVCQSLIWLIAVSHWLMPLPGLSYRLIYGAVAAWVLVIGYLSLRSGEDLPNPAAAPTKTRTSAQIDHTASLPAEAELPTESYSEAPEASEPDPRFDEVAAKLRQLMETKSLYREPALTIAQLSRRSGYPEYLVSSVINRRFGCPFWDYVNRYRVEAARACLLDPQDARTALDIAYDCGFTSKSTFNAAFKRLLNQTPSQCRRLGLQQAAETASAARPQPPAG